MPVDLEREHAWLAEWLSRLELLQPAFADGRRVWPYPVEPLAQLGPWSRPGLAAEVDDEAALTEALVQRLRARDRTSKTLVLTQRPALRCAATDDGRPDAERRSAVLVETHRELALAHPARAVDFAAAALRQVGAERNDRNDHNDQGASEALALAYSADALRFAGEAAQAEQAFETAEAALAAVAAQPATTTATVLILRAQHERDVGRSTEAEAQLERAARVAASNRLLRAEVLLEHAALCAWLEEPAAAWTKLEAAAEILPWTGANPVFYLTMHNVAAGRAIFFDAEAVLDELAEVDAADSPFDGPFFQAHRRWVKARALARLAEVDRVGAELRAAFEGFLDLGRADWALRSLGDLTLLGHRTRGARPEAAGALLERLVASPAYGWVRAREALRWRTIEQRRKAAWLRAKVQAAVEAVN